MQSLPNFYQAEMDYRRETLRRDWRPLRARRAARAAARNQVRASAPSPGGDC